MFSFDAYKSIPIGSLITLDDETADEYLDQVSELPPRVAATLLSPNTGAYVRGLIKSYNLNSTLASSIALTILRIAIGEIPLGALGGHLSNDLRLANDQAQQMAKELEHDIFAPIALELNASFRDRKNQTTKKPSTEINSVQTTQRNVLDLTQNDQSTPPKILSRENDI